MKWNSGAPSDLKHQSLIQTGAPPPPDFYYNKGCCIWVHISQFDANWHFINPNSGHWLWPHMVVSHISAQFSLGLPSPSKLHPQLTVFCAWVLILQFISNCCFLNPNSSHYLWLLLLASDCKIFIATKTLESQHCSYYSLIFKPSYISIIIWRYYIGMKTDTNINRPNRKPRNKIHIYA